MWLQSHLFNLVICSINILFFKNIYYIKTDKVEISLKRLNTYKNYFL